MDNDIFILMQLLSKKLFITITDIERAINGTKRQATYRIEKLNDLLKKENVPLISVDYATKNIIIAEETKNIMERFLRSMKQKEDYYFNKKERLIYLYLALFINIDYLSLNDLISYLQVSRSTVLSDIKELTQILVKKEIKIKYNRRNGYYLSGSEFEIRRIMMKYIIYTLAEEQNRKLFDIFINDFHLDIFEYSRLVIMELAHKHNIHLVQDRLVEFIYIFTFLKARMQSGKEVLDEIENFLGIDQITTMKEYEFTINLLTNYKDTNLISESDIKYITAWILGISFGDINENTDDCLLISDILGKILTRFESLSAAHYKNTQEIFVQLYSHFRPAYYRLIFKLPIYNPLCKRVKEEFKELYQLVEETMKPFYIVFGEEIPQGEIAYLTMHFATIYSGTKTFELKKQKTALVVCSNGIGSSVLLYNELTRMFPELHFLPPIQYSKIKEIKENIDLIFATNIISDLEESMIPIIRVRPVMSITERYQVSKEVYARLGSLHLTQPNIDNLMDIISKHTIIQNSKALYHELITYFARIDNIIDEKDELHLIDMVDKNLICLNVNASNWEEAVRIAYQPMKDKGFITQNYIEDTIRSVRSVGPYIVITKNIALPHTKPESGAIRCALGICVLKEPVIFGNPENDPVKYIFSLSATDNKKHLSAMAELVELFNNKKFLNCLDSAASTTEVIQYLIDNQNK